MPHIITPKFPFILFHGQTPQPFIRFAHYDYSMSIQYKNIYIACFCTNMLCNTSGKNTIGEIESTASNS